MKTKFLLTILTAVTLLFFQNLSYCQVPNLRSTFNFVLFTITGAVDNTGTSPINGDVGTDDGFITGFDDVTGEIHNADAVTEQCSADLLLAYNEVFNTTATNTSHTPSYGTGETLFPGVYGNAAAGSIAGDLILDGQNNTNAVFIFKFGGAFTTGASTTVYLTNGTSACNVFWIAEGAISMAASTVMKGTLIAHNGAISMGTTGSLEGRMFSTTGAVSVYNVTAPAPPCSVLPVELISFSAVCDKENILLKWSTASETNNDFFSIEQKTEGTSWKVIGTVKGAGRSTDINSYSFRVPQPDKAISWYRLKQTDFDGNYKYGEVVYIKKCGPDDAENISLYPNPTSGKFNFVFTGDMSKVYSTQIFNAVGGKVFESTGFQSTFDLSDKPPGVYIVNFNLYSKTITRKLMLE